MALSVGPDSAQELMQMTQTERELLVKAGYELEKWRLECIAEMFSN